MSLLEDTRPRRLTDPVFGEVTFDPRGRRWEGQVRFEPTRRHLRLVIDAGPEGPREVQRGAFELLSNLYRGLEPQIAEALSAQLLDAEVELDPPAATPAELLDLLYLELLSLWGDGRAELVYRTYPGQGAEARFVVIVDDGLVRGRFFEE